MRSNGSYTGAASDRLSDSLAVTQPATLLSFKAIEIDLTTRKLNSENLKIKFENAKPLFSRSYCLARKNGKKAWPMMQMNIPYSSYLSILGQKLKDFMREKNSYLK